MDGTVARCLLGLSWGKLKPQDLAGPGVKPGREREQPGLPKLPWQRNIASYTFTSRSEGTILYFNLPFPGD